MDLITYRTGAEARLGGLDITISLDETEAQALGAEAGQLADWFHGALWAITSLRTGRPTHWYEAISDLDNHLLPRLEGVRDAAVRAHDQSGDSLGTLAWAMGVPRSTAQYRRNVLRRTEPGAWERWASNGDPQNRSHVED